MKAKAGACGLTIAMALSLLGMAQGMAEAAVREIAPRWRGDNISSAYLDAALVRRIASLNGNALRFNMDPDKSAGVNTAPDGDALAPYRQTLARLDAVLPLCRESHIQVILSLSGVPGRKLDVFWKQTTDGQGYREKIVGIWTALAARYKDEPAIMAYDIMNEPTYKADEADSWWKETLPAAIAAVRKVDSTVWIVVEPGPWGMPSAFARMPVVADPRVIYSFHHYLSHAYTHQGLQHVKDASLPDMRGKLAYPGDAPAFEDGKESRHWDRAALESSMQAVIDFQKAHPGARIYVGEFGVIRWAPGGDQWLRDSISIFEAHGWDWTFHSLGDWNGWDASYGPDAPLSAPPGQGTEETDRLQAVKDGWHLNAADAAR